MAPETLRRDRTPTSGRGEGVLRSAEVRRCIGWQPLVRARWEGTEGEVVEAHAWLTRCSDVVIWAGYRESDVIQEPSAAVSWITAATAPSCSIWTWQQRRQDFSHMMRRKWFKPKSNWVWSYVYWYKRLYILVRVAQWFYLKIIHTYFFINKQINWKKLFFSTDMQAT